MNVKQGDLAIVIVSNSEANIGIICKVNSYIGKDRGLEDAWHITSVTRPFVFLSGAPATHDVHMPDYGLRPISGLPDTESTDEQLVKPVANLVSAA